MGTVILSMCRNFLINCIFYDFFRGQLRPRVKSRGGIFLILSACAAVLMAVNSLGSSLVNLVLGAAVFTAQALLLFQDEARREFFLILIGESVALFMEYMTALIFVRFPLWDVLRDSFHYDQAAEDIMMGAFAWLLTWAVLHGLKIYFLHARCAVQERFPLLLFCLPLSTILIYQGVFYEDMGKSWAEHVLHLGYLFLFAANILVFFTINKLFVVSERNRKQQLIEQQSALQQRYYHHLEEIDLGHRRYAHDLKNCMASIGALAAAGGNEDIVALLGEMETELDGLTGTHYTVSSVLNALLWEKSALSGRRGVRMEIAAGAEPEWAYIQGRDLIVMMGNLLDNAIEAAAQCREGSVRVVLYGEEHFLVAEVENTCTGQVRKQGEEFISTKQDAQNHGFGISSVRDTAQKYGGLLFTECKDGRFIAILTISRECLAG